MNKQKDKFYASLFLGYGYTLMVLFGLSFLAIIYFVIPTPFEDEDLVTQFIFLFMSGFLPIVLWICLIHRGFTLIEMNEQGVKTSLFCFFKIRFMTWDEIQDVKVSYHYVAWLFISTIDLKGLPFRKLVSSKNIIVIQFDENVLSIYNKYAKHKIE